MTKLELLAIVFALTKYDYYLLGRHFTILTDHRSLTYLLTQKRTNHLLDAWLDKLTSFDFDIVHLPGIQNHLPDYLSRVYDYYKRHAPVTTNYNNNNVLDNNNVSSNFAMDFNPITISPDVIPDTNATASSRTATMSTLDSEAMSLAAKQISQNDAPIPETPIELRSDALKQAHQFGHSGITGTISRLHSLNFRWPNMHNEVKNLVSSCPQCQQFNVQQHGFATLKSLSGEFVYPMQAICIDTKGPLPQSENGFTYYYVVRDIASMYCWLKPSRGNTAQNTAEVLMEIFMEYGFPGTIVMDNGIEYFNDLVSTLTKLAGIQQRFSSEYHPRSNGIAENLVKSSSIMLGKLVNTKIPTWDKHLPFIQLSLNTKIQTNTKTAPFTLMHGRTFDMPGTVHLDSDLLDSSKSISRELLKQLNTNMLQPTIVEPQLARITLMQELIFPTLQGERVKKHNKIVRKFSENHKIIDDFPLDSMVMTKRPGTIPALQPQYEGPYRVVHKTMGGAYILQTLALKTLERRFPPSLMKLVNVNSSQNQPLIQPAAEDHFQNQTTNNNNNNITRKNDTAVADSEDPTYTVEKLLKHKKQADGTYLYLVKWEGVPNTAAFNTWEPESSFDYLTLIHDYWNALNKQNKKSAATQRQDRRRT
jgi:hypothetical protein